MSKKPYLAGGREYLEMSRVKDWEEGDPTGGSAEYSEFQKPYKWEGDDKDNYPMWEWSWPSFPSLPEIGGITLPDIPEGGGECEFDDRCIWAIIMGPDTLDCPTSETYVSMHVWMGCSVAPWWAAFGTWELETSDPDNIFISSQTAFSATVEVTSNASDGVATLTYYGPGCTATKEIIIECSGCCASFTLSGADTVAPGSTWTGTISPACPYATCSVVSNSGCDLSCSINEAGSSVSVVTGGSDCGGFTVTVEDDGFKCTESDSKFVRITGGSWAHEYPSGDLGLAGCTDGVGCSVGGGANYFYDYCYQGEYKYGGFEVQVGHACEGTWLNQCKGTSEDPCSPDGEQPPCMSKSVPSCTCVYWGWWRCNWVCEC